MNCYKFSRQQNKCNNWSNE